MRIRYIGTFPVELAFPGGAIPFEPGQELDIDEALDDAGIARHHLEIVTRGLAGQPDWLVLEGDVERPADSATKATWVAFAVAHGFDEKAAKALTKGDLIAELDQLLGDATPDPDDDQEPAATPGQE